MHRNIKTVLIPILSFMIFSPLEADTLVSVANITHNVNTKKVDDEFAYCTGKVYMHSGLMRIPIEIINSLILDDGTVIIKNNELVQTYDTGFDPELYYDSGFAHEKFNYGPKEKRIKTSKKKIKPPLSPLRITGELLAGGAGGFVLGLGGALTSALMSGGFKSGGPYEGMPLGALVGSSIGVSASVYLVGVCGNETGSYRATLLGTITGHLIGFGIYSLFNIDNETLEFAMIFGLPAICGVIGFNSTRSYEKSPDTGNAIINLEDGQFTFAIPTVSIHSNPFIQGDFLTTVNLFDVAL